jgi:hypothetical protein
MNLLNFYLKVLFFVECPFINLHNEVDVIFKFDITVLLVMINLIKKTVGAAIKI